MEQETVIRTNHMAESDFEGLDPRDYIIIKGSRVNNLKSLSVAIPRNKLVVITGVSGSGKSSLAFDTLFAEGQRMYVESLSSYARQFLGRMEKPEVDYIRGVAPAIAIEQKVSTKNVRSTVGTTTEIYDYLKLLFARIGKTYHPKTGEEVKKDAVSDVVDFLQNQEEGAKYQIYCPLPIPEDRNLPSTLKVLLQQGFTRLITPEGMAMIEEVLSQDLKKVDPKSLSLLIDRGVVKKDEDTQYRMADSVQTAFFEGHGACTIDLPGKNTKTFNDRFEAEGQVFEEPSINFFSFNNSFGACKTCDGFGSVLGIDPDLVIPDKSLSVYEGAVAPWRSEAKRAQWLEPLLKNGIRFDFPIHRPVEDLTQEEWDTLWEGNDYFKGIHDFFHYLERKNHKIQNRVMLSRYRGRTTCPDCRGTRVRKDAGYVKIQGNNIQDIVLMSLDEAFTFFDELKLPEHEAAIAERIIKEIHSRLYYIQQVGLGYLTLNRLTATLSGGEFQRIKLATSLGSALVGSMYILDEPSIGLHPRDTNRLVEVLQTLRDLGNTVIVVEHEEEVIRAADQVIDIGPEAGSHGGELVFQGDWDEIETNKAANKSLTARYLKGDEHIPVPDFRRKWNEYIQVKGAAENNLKKINVKFPLYALSVVTGVSGSGKSTLVKKILYPSLLRAIGGSAETVGTYDSLGGSIQKVSQLEFVDQSPIGKSSRSNPVTYIKAYDEIRSLYADLPLSQQRGYKPSRFSFNVEGGRCENCKGEGTITVEMQFMADIRLTCEECKGKRFKDEILEVEYNGKNIADVLDLTVDDAIVFFAEQEKIVRSLQPLQDVGLGYIKLGQSSNTLSGGEAQRVKLAFYLSKASGNVSDGVFIFDEPTTGLHFHDIKKLLQSINMLIEQGNTVIIIEHNVEVIKCADWVIDLGPEGGKQGGQVCFEGLPEELAQNKDNHTGHYLADKL